MRIISCRIECSHTTIRINILHVKHPTTICRARRAVTPRPMVHTNRRITSETDKRKWSDCAEHQNIAILYTADRHDSTGCAGMDERNRSYDCFFFTTLYLVVRKAMRDCTDTHARTHSLVRLCNTPSMKHIERAVLCYTMFALPYTT